jgi:flagellar motor switch protein FliG
MSQENTAKIFASLAEDEIKLVSQYMATLGFLDKQIIDGVMEEFKNEISNHLSLIGNLDTTQKLLESVLGKDKVDAILEDIKGPIGKSTWDKLTNINEDLLAAYLKNEHPQTVALILSKISTNIAAKVLITLPEELAYEVMMRLLNMDSVKKEVLESIETTLRNDFINTISKVQKRDSHELMAEIFNNFDRSNEAKFMSMLEERVPEHAEKVKELMFTFDDIAKLKPEDIVNLLRYVDKGKLAIALKGANENIREMFISSMSQRASKIFMEDMEALGPIRVKDVDEAQVSIITVVKEMIEREEIILSSGDGDDEFIE